MDMNDSQKNVLRLEVQKAIQRGWSLTPLDGKKPLLGGWTTRPALSLEEAVEFVNRGFNLGVRTGYVSGVAVVDDDTENQDAAEKLNLPPCPTAITGSGKRHHYFKAPACELKNSVGRLMDGVDVRGDDGQVVLAGSLHPDTGEPYGWAEEMSPEDIDLPDFPKHLLGRLSASRVTVKKSGTAGTAQPKPLAQTFLDSAVYRVRTAQKSTRNCTLNAEAFGLGSLVQADRLDRDLVEDALMEAALEAGLEEEESEKTIESGLEAGLKARHAIQRTDSGNAILLVGMHGDSMLYCGQWREWYVWNGSHWEADHRELLQAFAKDVAAELSERSRESDDDTHGGRKWAKQSANVAGLTNMVRAARDLVSVSPDEFDQNPWLLNVANGTIDLQKGELRPHRQEDRLTKMAPVSFDSDATCSRFEEFLKEVMPDEEARDFLQRAVGCSLYGGIRDHVLFFCHGGGANGKSTFLNALQSTLGRDYAIQAAPGLILNSGREEHTTGLTDLCGARMVICSEIGAGRALNEDLVKRLTGGEPIRARRMRQDFWEFEPTHHLWAGANAIPEVSAADEAMWRRLLLIPFTVCIPEEQRDTELLQKLKKELPGILSWAVKGCLLWQKQGLDIPDAVRVSSANCRLEMDTLGRFISEHLEEKTGARLPFSMLYPVYEAWCEDEGIDPEPRNHFGTNLTKRGYEKRRVHGNPVYLGLSLIPGGRGGSTSPYPPEESELGEVTGSLSPTSPPSPPTLSWIEDPFADDDPYGEGSSPSAA